MGRRDVLNASERKRSARLGIHSRGVRCRVLRDAPTFRYGRLSEKPKRLSLLTCRRCSVPTATG